LYASVARPSVTAVIDSAENRNFALRARARVTCKRERRFRNRLRGFDAAGNRTESRQEGGGGAAISAVHRKDVGIGACARAVKLTRGEGGALEAEEEPQKSPRDLLGEARVRIGLRAA